jgi:SMC interacting uncharacterized protein involved in chromosome segregation
MADDTTQLKVDVEVLKTQITTLTSLCTKMDQVIDRLVEQQDRYTIQIYTEMEQRRTEKNGEIKEIHDRIDTIIDKVQITELRIMDEIKELRSELMDKKSSSTDVTTTKWAWMVAGGMIVISWLISHVNFDKIGALLK